MILGDSPVTYKLFPGFSTSGVTLLERDRDTDLLYRLYGDGEGEGEGEYLDLLEYDVIVDGEWRELKIFEF